MTVFLLKIIAVICMVCDHIRYIKPIVLDTETTRMLGRMAFPIFAFLIAEGYTHTKDIKKYIKRLLIFSLISQIPFMIFVYGCNLYKFDWNNILSSIELNVIFTLLLGVLAILSFDKINNKVLKVIVPVLIMAVAEFAHTDYGAIGVLIIVCFYLLRNHKIIRNVIVTSILWIWLTRNIINQNGNWEYCIPFYGGYLFSGILLSCYDGKLGKYKLKYFFYLFYPIHMIAIYFIHNLVN